MSFLEARIPPPAAAAATALAMWGIAFFAPQLMLPAGFRSAACIVFAIAGLSFSVAGLFAFRRAQTTANPTKPEAASTLVVTGIYRFTRNPMYVGVVLVLVAWAVFLSSAWALLGPVAFVLFITRFQIAPEERALSKRFGSEYASYKARVRRWL